MNDAQNSSSWPPHRMAILGLIILDLICSKKIIVLLNDVKPLSFTQPISFSHGNAVMKESWTKLPSPESQTRSTPTSWETLGQY